MDLAENTVVAGRFRLNRLLAQGGMGSVWHATHLGLEIPCAVKFIDPSSTDLFGAQARFTREARAAAQLRSPHVVQILDHGVWEGTPYIAMELLEGEDLASRLARLRRLSPAELYAILSQVCRALTKAHSVGIVHRDLKPDNIFLVRDDEREIAKVLDFGIAKQHVAELSGVSTRTGAMLGTPQYMSPEQATGVKAVDGRSDLWSLAVIAYQALTGDLPFTSEALGELILKIVVEPIPVPSAHGPVPPGFDQWWAKATSRDPAGRFQSARELADSLALVCGVTADLGRSGASTMTRASSAEWAVESAPVTDREPAPMGEPPVAPVAPWGPPDRVAAFTPAPIAQSVEGRAAPKRRGPLVPILVTCGVMAVAGAGFAVFFISSLPRNDASAAGTTVDPLPAAAAPPAPPLPTEPAPAAPSAAMPTPEVAATPSTPSTGTSSPSAAPSVSPSPSPPSSPPPPPPRPVAPTTPRVTTPPTAAKPPKKPRTGSDLGF